MPASGRHDAEAGDIRYVRLALARFSGQAGITRKTLPSRKWAGPTDGSGANPARLTANAIFTLL